MKAYPSISHHVETLLPIVAFDKLDGSNVRAEWSTKRGWYKFGTRHRVIDNADPLLSRVPELIIDKYGERLGRALKDTGYPSAVCFFEFWGPSSFAGNHDLNETQTVTLFDIAPFNQGILEPERYLSLVDRYEIDHARVLYVGTCATDFIDSVRNSALTGMTFEGVVCKSRSDKRTKLPVMFKQKSQAWLDKLKIRCGDDADLFASLI